jgi:hypothetical protein
VSAKWVHFTALFASKHRREYRSQLKDMSRTAGSRESISFRVILGVLVVVLIPRAPGNQSRRFPPSPDGAPLRYGGFLTATSTPLADNIIIEDASGSRQGRFPFGEKKSQSKPQVCFFRFGAPETRLPAYSLLREFEGFPWAALNPWTLTVPMAMTRAPRAAVANTNQPRSTR